MNLRACFQVIFTFLVVSWLPGILLGQQGQQKESVEQIRAVLDAIHPYLPKSEVEAPIQVFGSTSMDTMAHGWATGFQKFHPQAKVEIASEGSETVFRELASHPFAVGMISRPVSPQDLEKLQKAGLKQPVAIMVAREALGVFVHESNPLRAIDYQQMITLFCADSSEQNIQWNAVGVTGNLAAKPVELIGRDAKSGTNTFVQEFLFGSHKMRSAKTVAASNTKLVKAVEENPQAIAISGLKCGGHGARVLQLEDNNTVIPNSDHAILVGKYPLTRPLTLVVDIAQEGPKAEASREFVRFALSQAGQMQAILSGFYPFDPPTLRAEGAKLESAKSTSEELETARRPSATSKK